MNCLLLLILWLAKIVQQISSNSQKHCHLYYLVKSRQSDLLVFWKTTGFFSFFSAFLSSYSIGPLTHANSELSSCQKQRCPVLGIVTCNPCELSSEFSMSVCGVSVEIINAHAHRKCCPQVSCYGEVVYGILRNVFINWQRFFHTPAMLWWDCNANNSGFHPQITLLQGIYLGSLIPLEHTESVCHVVLKEALIDIWRMNNHFVITQPCLNMFRLFFLCGWNESGFGNALTLTSS